MLFAQLLAQFSLNVGNSYARDNPVDTGRKFNVHKTVRRRPGRLLNLLCTLNLCLVSTGNVCSKSILRTLGVIYYLIKIFRITNISYPLIRTRTCAYQGVRYVSFSEKFVYLLNEFDNWMNI